MADLLPIMGAGSYSYLENTSNELELLKEYAYDIEKEDRPEFCYHMMTVDEISEMIGCDFKECAAEIREFIYGK